MAWGKAGSTTLTSAGDDIGITSMTASKFNEVLGFGIASGSLDNNYLRFNDESTSVYAFRKSDNGGTDASSAGDTGLLPMTTSGTKNNFFNSYICNISGEEKLVILHTIIDGGSGAGNYPDRKELVGKYVPSPDADITRIDYVNTGSGSFDTDSNITALGSDITPAAAIPFAENAQTGSRAEITDTRKMYHRFGETADVSGTDLKVYWKFNDASGSIVNSAGNVTGNSTLGSDADLAILGTGTPVYKQESPSGISKSVEFGQTATSPNFGQGQYGRTASNLSQFSFMCTGTPQFTVCFWAKSSSNTFVNNQNFLGDNMGDTTRGFKIYYYLLPDGSNGMTTSMTKTGGGNNQPIRGTSPAQFWVADGAWHFYVFTIDYSLGSNQGYMSRDISGSTYSYSKNTPTPDSSGDTSYPMNFRNDAPNNEYGIPPTTQYAEFSIWDRVLTSAEISKLYNSGNGAQLDNRWDEEGT
tara:strand:- start:100 stop:1509 length:1410 start_codon:yes stop_codon:yes gene_type:complete